MGEDLPLAGRERLGVDGDDDALGAELPGRLGDELGPGDGGGVDRDLVGAGQQKGADVLDPAHPAADGEGHETLLRRAPDDVIEGVAVLNRGGDVEETEFVRPLAVIDPGLGHRVAGVDEIDEVDALDDAPVLDVETGNDAYLQHYPVLLRPTWP